MPAESPLVQAILVPQGAEYRAVCRGLSGAGKPAPIVVPIPIGTIAVKQFLQTQPFPIHPLPTQILVMGLCGSLTPRLGVGDGVIYSSCLALTGEPLPDLSGTMNFQIQSRLGDRIVPVRALISDRFIHAAQEKLALHHTHQADVVDMEGSAVLQTLQPMGIGVTMVRVVSDGCDHDMPDLSRAIDPQGNLLPGAMAVALMGQPIAATRLIRGSLRGLQALQQLTTALFQPPDH